MDWHYLGHAMWLAELEGLRVLFDPLLADLHHGDVFEVEPSRAIHAEALRPDFLIVSHQHPDHFDVPSMRRLAQLDDETVFFTADELVAETARRVGFRTVRALETWSRVDLQGARLASTPSYNDEVEWGVMVETREGVVWNQIDSYHQQISDVTETLAAASKVFDRDLTTGLDLAFVRWQPVLETQGPLGERAGFPFREYADALGRIAAVGAKAVVPSAAGVRQAAPYAFMNHYVYPVPLARVLRDLPRRAPGLEVLAPRVGATYRVRNGVTVRDDEGARAYATVLAPARDADPRATLFRPYEMPPIADPNPHGLPVPALRAATRAWVHGALAQGLARAYPSMGVSAPLRFALELVFEGATDAYTLEVSSSGAAVREALDDDYDGLITAAGSLVADVVEGRRQWGDPLLGGMLRSSLRAYDLNPEGLAVARVSTTWLYYGLSYEQSCRNAVEFQLRKLGC